MGGIYKMYKNIGPGFMVAAAGIGAGDMVVGIHSGVTHGLGLLWAVVLAVILKYYLTEGIARWQLSTNTTIIEGWTQKLHKVFSVFFLILLVIWSFSVAGALISACGMAGHALFPILSIKFWGVFHSLLAALLIYLGNYSKIENITKILVFMMFIVIIITAISIKPSLQTIFHSLKPDFSLSSFTLVFAILGGIGGSVTMISYGYWLREKKWDNLQQLKNIRLELAASYIFTGVFVFALMVIAANLGKVDGSGIQLILSMANQLEITSGFFAKTIFIIGFWGVVFSSILCVWQGIPYIFADFINNLFGKKNHRIQKLSRTFLYNSFLIFLAGPPILLIFFNDPVSNIIHYAIISTVFIVFLAGTLLYLNNRSQWVRQYRNNWFSNAILGSAIVLFILMLLNQIKIL